MTDTSRDADNRLKRIETRLTKLMLHQGCDPNFDTPRVVTEDDVLVVTDLNVTMHELRQLAAKYRGPSSELQVVYKGKTLCWIEL